MRHVAIAVVLVLVTGTLSAQSDQPTIFPVVRTAPLASYEEAPATPDADDPAIWVNPDDHRRSLVIGTAKDAGIVVHDLSGRLVQALLPPTRRRFSTVIRRRPAAPTPPRQSVRRQCQRRNVRPLQQRGHRVRPEARTTPSRPTRRRGRCLGPRL